MSYEGPRVHVYATKTVENILSRGPRAGGTKRGRCYGQVVAELIARQ